MNKPADGFYNYNVKKMVLQRQPLNHHLIVQQGSGIKFQQVVAISGFIDKVLPTYFKYSKLKLVLINHNWTAGCRKYICTEYYIAQNLTYLCSWQGSPCHIIWYFDFDVDSSLLSHFAGKIIAVTLKL